MENAIIAGIFSIISALASIWLKDYLERKRTSIPSSSEKAKFRKEQKEMLAPRWNIFRPLIILFGGFFIGGMNTPFGSPLLVLVSLGLALNHRHRGFWLFQLEIFTLWAAFLSGGWAIGYPLLWSLNYVIIYWLGCAIIGGIIANKKQEVLKIQNKNLNV